MKVGLKKTQPIYRDTIEYRANVKWIDRTRSCRLVLIHVSEKPAVNFNPEEVMETRWIDYHDLQAEVQRWPERYYGSGSILKNIPQRFLNGC